MVSFPILKSLAIEKYGLFIPSLSGPFVIVFQPGPNAIVGVNGSGKSTLINMALRCLTGPYNLPSATSESELGQVRPKAIQMPRYERQLFARRVADGAENATATLVVEFAGAEFTISRNLSDLSLVSVAIDGIVQTLTPDSERPAEDDRYHSLIANAMGVATFFDVLIVLRFLVFMLEDRRALVWDPTAQRQIFRVLLLPSDQATDYANEQQAIISADSGVRNIQAQITRYEKQAVNAKKRAKNIADAEAERRVLAKEADVLRESVDAAAKTRIEADSERHSARLDRLKAAETRESLVRELERIKLESLRSLLGPSNETITYIVGHLLAEQRCLVCGTDPSPAAKQIEDWIKAGKCPVCGSKHQATGNILPLSDAIRARIERLEKELALAESQIQEADQRIVTAVARFEKAEADYSTLERKRISLDARIVAVLRRIPTERAAIGSHEDDVDALRRILANEKTRLTKAENRFRVLVAESVKRVQNLQDEIADSFGGYLQVFLKEKAELVYQVVKARVGQAGAIFEFPAFHLSMTGGAVAGQTMRDNPEQVSHSQAEFVDLAFRMALMSIAGNGGAASLVVDAPEASLDFLFAERAGQQLARFSRIVADNRVIITSYLPSDHLLLSFFKSVRSERERRSRIVDLIQHAAPNAAMRADRPKYEAFLANIISGKAN